MKAEEGIKVEEIEIGKEYNLSGDIKIYVDGKSDIYHEEVTRVVTKLTDTHVCLQCGRMFIINDNLKITVPYYRR